jgi:uncharacterized protein YjbI with pentapeptide repeats
MQGVVLDGAVLKGSKWQGTKMEGAKMNGIDMANSDLTGARYGGSVLFFGCLLLNLYFRYRKSRQSLILIGVILRVLNSHCL